MEKEKNNKKTDKKTIAAVIAFCVLAAAIITISVLDNGNRFSLFTHSNNGQITISEWVLGALLVLLAMIVFMFACTFAGVACAVLTERKNNRLRARQMMGKDALIRIDPAAKLAYKGIQCFLGKDYLKAADRFNEAIETAGISDDNKEFCFRWLATCYRNINDKKQYTQTLLRHITAVPTSDGANLEYGRMLMINGEIEKAEFYFLQALKYNPLCASAQYNLGEIELVRVNYEKAHERYHAATALDTNFPYPIFEDAVVYMLEGNVETAEREYSRALAIDGDEEIASDEPAERMREKLDAIRDARKTIEKIADEMANEKAAEKEAKT